MPWRSSFPCHRMCCGPETLLWFALAVFRVADMIGIDTHVSFLPQKKEKKKKSAARLAGSLLGRAGSLPQGVAHSVRRRRAGCLPGAVASQHAHQPTPLGRSCLFLPWPAPGHHAPTGGPPVRPPAVLAASQSAIAYISCTAWSCMSYLSISGPELYRSHTCLRSYSQARQPHLVWVGIQVSACKFCSHLTGEVHLGFLRCPSAIVYTTLSTAVQPVRPTLHSSSLALHDTIIATPQDRSAWHGLVAPCFPH